MYAKSSGLWKSDFRIKGIRYQRTWQTKDYKKALLLESNWKKFIINPKKTSSHVNFTFKEASDYLYEVKWKYLRDSSTPLSRWTYIAIFFGLNKLISLIRIDDLDRFKQYLVNKNYANKTINHYISDLKTGIELLQAKQKVSLQNTLSFEGLRMSLNSKRKICFTKDEEKQMYNTFVSTFKNSNHPDDWQMIQYFIINSSLGLRPAEYLNLQLGDFDLEQKTVTISRGSYNSTKNDLIRTLPLEGTVLDAVLLQIKFSLKYLHHLNLDSNLTIHEINQIINSAKAKKLIVTSLTKDMVTNRWNKMKKELQWIAKETYKEYIPYGLRHTVASRLASLNKWNGYKIQTFMGHKSFHTSLNYVHLDVDDIRDGSCTNNQDIELVNYF
jgi:integrase